LKLEEFYTTKDIHQLKIRRCVSPAMLTDEMITEISLITR